MTDAGAQQQHDIKLAEALVERLLHPEASPDKDQRRVHALGICATGAFVASPVAADFCIARHFRGSGDAPAPGQGPRSTRVTVRFSNGSGGAVRHDGWSDVRGMATRFHLDDATHTDLVCMTLPEFFTPTPEAFHDFAVAAYPRAFARPSPWRRLLDYLRLVPPLRPPYPGERIRPDEGAMRYADANPHARAAVFQAASIGAPRSYVRAAYHAVHTFFVVGPDGTRRPVRFTWQPIDGVLNLDPARPEDAALLEKDYLDATLAERLAQGPARFSLMMVIGEAGDDLDDCARPWPPHRVRVNMGTLTLDALLDGEGTGDSCELLRFNPWTLTEGIEPSGDSVLRSRRYAYEISSAQRYAARGLPPCPFSWS